MDILVKLFFERLCEICVFFCCCCCCFKLIVMKIWLFCLIGFFKWNHKNANQIVISVDSMRTAISIPRCITNFMGKKRSRNSMSLGSCTVCGFCWNKNRYKKKPRDHAVPFEQTANCTQWHTYIVANWKNLWHLIYWNNGLFSIFRGLTYFARDLHKHEKLDWASWHTDTQHLSTTLTQACGRCYRCDGLFHSIFLCSHPIGMSCAHSSEYAFRWCLKARTYDNNWFVYTSDTLTHTTEWSGLALKSLSFLCRA